MVRTVLTALLVLWASVAQSATYYVSPTGNDTNACTAPGSSACLTLAGANAKSLAAGDVVEVATGTYAGVTITKSGSTGNPITWRGHGGTCPTVTVRDPNSRGSRPDPTVTLTSSVTIMANDVTVECFKVTDGGIVTYGATTRLAITDNAIVCAVAGCTGISVWGAGGFLGEDATYVTVSRNYLYGTGPARGTLLVGTHLTYTDNEQERMQGVGDNDYVQVWGDDIVLRGNYWHGNQFDDAPTAHSDCVQTFILNTGMKSNNVTIDRNTCFHADEGFITQNDTADASLHTGWIVTNNVWAYQRIGGPERPPGGGGFGGTTNSVFHHNTAYLMNLGCGRDDSQVVATVTARNNILYNGIFTTTVGKCTVTVSNTVTSADALFVSVTEQQLMLASSASTAINTGYDLSACTTCATDRRGVSRPQGAGWDVGAYESGYLPNPPTNPREP